MARGQRHDDGEARVEILWNIVRYVLRDARLHHPHQQREKLVAPERQTPFTS
jgi:hypothetical protein